MPHPRIILCFDPPAAEEAEWWATELPPSWPRSGEPIACTCMPLARLLEELAGPEPLRTRYGPPPIVVAIAGPESASPLMQLADRLLGARLPALVLTREVARLRPELEPHGLIVESLGATRTEIARMLHALAARQPAVEALASELRVARASQGGLTGEISRLHDELQLAGTVQRRFLPKALPEISGYDFGVLFRPCGYVSGDIYDLVRIDESRLAFMLADAVGHGVPAALLTLVLGRALRQPEARDGEHPLASPARTLERLNAELCLENEAGDRFATAVCGVVDTQRHRITLASAGHPAPILIGSDRTPRPVSGGEGPLLGVFDGAPYSETTVEIGPGESLLLFTDGFEVAFPETASGPVKATHAYLGHFARILGGLAGRVHDGLARLAGEIDAQSGSLHQRDDLTAVAIRRLPRAEEGVVPERLAA